MTSLAVTIAIAALGVFAQPPHPLHAAATLTLAADSESVAIYKAARKYPGAKIMISTRERWLWFVVGRDTLLSAPVAIGTGNDFEWGDKKYRFETPRGRRKVLKKEENPIWTVPEWHYLEKAANRGLEPVYVKPGEIYPLGDGTWIELRDGEVGRVNHFGNFWPFTPGIEILFDGKIFIPPMDSPQRRVPDALGPVKLDMGNGYLIHGTHEYNRDSIGLPASHGCVRMYNDDVVRLAEMVEPGPPVFIF
ncbi:MAG: L,D-transpeptidase [Gemmatimonadota bacterium]